MARRILLTIEYDGTAYSGWQRQENAVTVQETVENAIYGCTGEQVSLIGCGRTDSGVHAILKQIQAFRQKNFRAPLMPIFPRRISVATSQRMQRRIFTQKRVQKRNAILIIFRIPISRMYF